MKVTFEGKTKTFFPAFKLTLVPGENTIDDKLGGELLKAHNEACKRGGDKPCIKEVSASKPAAPVATSASSTKPSTSASAKPPTDDKKGAK